MWDGGGGGREEEEDPRSSVRLHEVSMQDFDQKGCIHRRTHRVEKRQERSNADEMCHKTKGAMAMAIMDAPVHPSHLVVRGRGKDAAQELLLPRRYGWDPMHLKSRGFQWLQKLRSPSSSPRCLPETARLPRVAPVPPASGAFCLEFCPPFHSGDNFRLCFERASFNE